MNVRLRPEASILAVIDLQPGFLIATDEAERVVLRSTFLARSAQVLEIPVLISEQNPVRMGSTLPAIASCRTQTVAKMSFSAWREPQWQQALADSGRRQVVIVGIETHICVAQTALDLLSEGFEVVVCPDAVSAGSLDRHKLGMEFIRDGGVVPMHSEAVVYEWMQSAEHPAFREILQIVKQSRPVDLQNLRSKLKN